MGLGGTIRWMRLNWAPLWVRQGHSVVLVVTKSRGKRVSATWFGAGFSTKIDEIGRNWKQPVTLLRWLCDGSPPKLVTH